MSGSNIKRKNTSNLLSHRNRDTWRSVLEEKEWMLRSAIAVLFLILQTRSCGTLQIAGDAYPLPVEHAHFRVGNRLAAACAGDRGKDPCFLREICTHFPDRHNEVFRQRENANI